MLAKSFVAPIDRIKILYQVTSAQFRLRDVPRVARSIVEKEGWGALWKGNLATMIRVFPYRLVWCCSLEFIGWLMCRCSLVTSLHRTFFLVSQSINQSKMNAITNSTTTHKQWHTIHDIRLLQKLLLTRDGTNEDTIQRCCGRCYYGTTTNIGEEKYQHGCCSTIIKYVSAVSNNTIINVIVSSIRQKSRPLTNRIPPLWNVGRYNLRIVHLSIRFSTCSIGRVEKAKEEYWW